MRRTSVAIAAVLLSLNICGTRGAIELDYDPLKLPPCTPEQEKMRTQSKQCYFGGISALEGSGVCPKACCCDQQTSLSVNSTLYTFGTPGSCTVSFIYDSKRDVVALWMHPFSVKDASSRKSCAETTTEICGSLGIGKGCRSSSDRFPSPSPSASKDEKSKAVSGDERSEGGGGGKSKRAWILGGALAGGLLLLVLAAVGYFIVRPWLRNDLSSSEGDFDDEYGAYETSPSHQTELHACDDRDQ